MDIAALILGLCLIPSGLVMAFASWGAKLEIAKAAPDYAVRLYQPIPDQIIFGYWPIRSRVLFREPIPPQIRGTVRMLRGIYAAHWLVFALFLCCVFALAVSAVH